MVIKEGLYDAIEHRDNIFKICRFASTNDPEKLTSLKDYIERMKDGQENIFYITGENVESLRNSPQLEGFKSRGIEVLLLADTVDEFWLQQITEHDGKKFQSVTKGDVDLSKFEGDKNEDETEEDSPENLSDLATFLKEELSDHISNVRASKRLTESPVCLVAADNATDMNMEKVLKIHQNYNPETKRVLEINPNHALIKKLNTMIAENKDNALLKDSAQMLMDQALIIQGESLPDPTGFAKRMAQFMEKGLLSSSGISSTWIVKSSQNPMNSKILNRRFNL